MRHRGGKWVNLREDLSGRPKGTTACDKGVTVGRSSGDLRWSAGTGATPGSAHRPYPGLQQVTLTVGGRTTGSRCG